MTTAGYRVSTFTLPVSPAAAILVAPASTSRVRLLISAAPATAGDFATVGPDASIVSQSGLSVIPEAGPIELCRQDHGNFAQGALYAVASAALRLTVIEFFADTREGRA